MGSLFLSLFDTAIVIGTVQQSGINKSPKHTQEIIMKILAISPSVSLVESSAGTFFSGVSTAQPQPGQKSLRLKALCRNVCNTS